MLTGSSWAACGGWVLPLIEMGGGEGAGLKLWGILGWFQCWVLEEGEAVVVVQLLF